MIRRALAVVLVALLAAPPGGSAAALGVVRGIVTTEGRPLSGVTVALIDVESGRVHRATSEATGAFEAKVAPGQYVVTTEGRAGLSVGQAPGIIPVSAGQTSSTRIELVAVNLPLTQEMPPPLPPGEGMEPALPAPPASLPESTTTPASETTPASLPLEGPGESLPEGAPAIAHEPVACFVVG